MLRYFINLPTGFRVKLFTSFLSVQLANLLPKVFVVFVEKGNIHYISHRLLGLVVVSWRILTLQLGVIFYRRLLLVRAL